MSNPEQGFNPEERIEDPEKAEFVARSSKSSRDKAAKNRVTLEDLHDVDLLDSKNASNLKDQTRTQDKSAEEQEKYSATIYDELENIKDLPLEDLQARQEHVSRELDEATNRKEAFFKALAENNMLGGQTVKMEQKTLELSANINNILARLGAIRQRITELTPPD